MRICYILVVIAILYSGIAQAGNIAVEPNKYDIDLTASETITLPINITWTGDSAVVGFLSTEVEPDWEGITVNYSDSVVVLLPNEKKHVNMTIATAVNLMPGRYVITTKVNTEIEKIVKYKEKIVHENTVEYGNADVENLTKVNILLDMIDQLNQKLNETRKNVSNPEILKLLENISIAYNALNQNINSAMAEMEKNDNQSQPLLIWAVLVSLSFVVVLLLLLVAFLYKKIKTIVREESEKVDR